MFTGLVEEMGEVISVARGEKSLKIKIRCNKVLEGAKIGDSIATNGTCLTAVELGNNYFTADCMFETVKRTNLKRLKSGSKVNLEKSLTLATPLGGHLVTGDVDCEGKIMSIKQEGIAKIYEISVEPRLMKYVVEKGRITLDGASLTIVGFTKESISVSLIPHTQEMITLGYKRTGDYINVETDLIGKYVERLLHFDNKNKEEKKGKGIDEKFLLENGFF
ncbi:riboflavin synthase [uncultured Ilyobacter sp.]|uniref:riboflavin synthase n=1 Tax=uncultured Ilyobacter sp. TaxID=544433 RepID=UPI0029C79B75|nr:riboflavin synthase [uncultured Ilyobacter sp.]